MSRVTSRFRDSVMNEIDVVDILDPVTGEVVTHCFGPTAEGKCPLAGPGGIVHCQGSRIEPRNLGPEYWDLWVPPTSTVCPSTVSYTHLRAHETDSYLVC